MPGQLVANLAMLISTYKDGGTSGGEVGAVVLEPHANEMITDDTTASRILDLTGTARALSRRSASHASRSTRGSRPASYASCPRLVSSPTTSIQINARQQHGPHALYRKLPQPDS